MHSLKYLFSIFFEKIKKSASERVFHPLFAFVCNIELIDPISDVRIRVNVLIYLTLSDQLGKYCPITRLKSVDRHE